MDNCPPCASQSHFSFVAAFPLAQHAALVLRAAQAQRSIRHLGRASDVLSIEPLPFLHLSLYYFCCHTLKGICRTPRPPRTHTHIHIHTMYAEKALIEATVQGLEWQGVSQAVDGLGCNVDAQAPSPVYVHAQPYNATLLDALAAALVAAVGERGIALVPRTSMFHVTLARVGPGYPVAQLLHEHTGGLGSVVLCRFMLYPNMVWSSVARGC